jgi:hypothetical protein
LPQNVEPPVRVIPHIPAELAVDNAADGKLERGYYRRARNAAQPKFAIVQFALGEIDKRHARSAGQRHCPVSETAERYLKQTVYNGAAAVCKGTPTKLSRYEFSYHFASPTRKDRIYFIFQFESSIDLRLLFYSTGKKRHKLCRWKKYRGICTHLLQKPGKYGKLPTAPKTGMR